VTRGLWAIVAGAFALHALQGLLLPTAWLLPDELHASDAARATARDGFASLWAVVTWPFWLGGTEVGYEAAKLLGAAAVAAAAVPASALARLVASERASLVAAGAAVLAPATVLASTAHPVAVAYPVATAATLLLVRGTSGRAAVLGALAVLLWPPLFFPALAVGVFAYVRRVTPRALLEWPSAALVIAVPAALYAGVAGGRVASDAFRRATDAWDDVPLAAGASLGALALGVAIVPVVAALAALIERREQREPWSSLLGVVAVEVTALLVVAALLGLGRTGGGRAADEVALLPALPLLLAVAVGAGTLLRRRPLAVAAATVAVAILLVPGANDRHAPGLALADAVGLDPRLYGIALGLLVANIAVALQLTRRRGLLPALALGAAALLVPGELAAWADARDVPDVPRNLDAAASGRPVTVFAEGVELGVVYSVLFWAPTASIADPPLSERALVTASGMYQPPLRPGLVLDLVGSRMAGSVVLETPLGALVDTGPVARAAETIEGIYSDTWSSGDAYYRRFGGDPRPGVVLIEISRTAWRGPSPQAQVVVTSKPIGGEPFAERITSIESGLRRVVRLSVPPPPFEVKVAIGPTFSPADFGGTDRRQLGAQLAFDYRPG